MGKDSKNTLMVPKASLFIPQVGSGNELKTATAGSNVTFKHSTSNVLATLAVSDQTLRDKSLKDIVLTVDYKAGKGVTANAKYDAFKRVSTLGATWDGQLRGKNAQLKFWMADIDRLPYGDAKLALDKNTTAQLSFNQQKLLLAKYTINHGQYTYEPTYNFVRETPAVAVTRRSGTDTYRVGYDFKAETASLEFARKPFKIVMSSKVASDFKYAGKPSLMATFENIYYV